MQSRLTYFALAFSVLVLDQATKLLADQFLRGKAAVVVIPDFFNLWYSRNPGGLFGFFTDWGTPARTVLLTVMPALAVVLLSAFLARGSDEDRTTLVGLALILGGATGNLIDRLVRGEVVDFLDVYAPAGSLARRLETWFGTSHWPTFNVADSAIVVGACCLVLRIVRPVESSSASRSVAD